MGVGFAAFLGGLKGGEEGVARSVVVEEIGWCKAEITMLLSDWPVALWSPREGSAEQRYSRRSEAAETLGGGG